MSGATSSLPTIAQARRLSATGLRLGYAGLRVALALVAAVSYVLPWHRVYEQTGGVSPGMAFDTGCAAA